MFLTGAVVFFDMLFFAALTPLLPHFAHALHLGKTGAGVLSAAYPAGAFVGAVPSGIVAARAGVKPTVIAGLTAVGACTVLFGLGTSAWQLDLARFCQGIASAFSWTGALTWLIAAAPTGRRGRLIGRTLGVAVAGSIFGPVLGGTASIAGQRGTFVTAGIASLALVAWAARTPGLPVATAQGPSRLMAAFLDRRIAAGAWLVLLPSILFGTLNVLAPLRLSALGFGAVAIGAVFLCCAALEAGWNIVLGRLSDRHGPAGLVRIVLLACAIVAVALPWTGSAWLLAALVVVAAVVFGSLFTPAFAILTHASEERGLELGYTFALINLAWAPGQTLGTAGGASLAHLSGDAAPYLLLAGLCLLTVAGPMRRRRDTSLEPVSRAAG